MSSFRRKIDCVIYSMLFDYFFYFFWNVIVTFKNFETLFVDHGPWELSCSHSFYIRVISTVFLLLLYWLLLTQNKCLNSLWENKHLLMHMNCQNCSIKDNINGQRIEVSRASTEKQFLIVELNARIRVDTFTLQCKSVIEFPYRTFVLVSVCGASRLSQPFGKCLLQSKQSLAWHTTCECCATSMCAIELETLLSAPFLAYRRTRRMRLVVYYDSDCHLAMDQHTQMLLTEYHVKSSNNCKLLVCFLYTVSIIISAAACGVVCEYTNTRAPN